MVRLVVTVAGSDVVYQQRQEASSGQERGGVRVPERWQDNVMSDHHVHPAEENRENDVSDDVYL